MDKEEKFLLFSVLNLLVIDVNQLELKCEAAERVLRDDPRLHDRYDQVLQSVRDHPAVTSTSQVLEELRQKLFSE
jgi:hypothetical protein